MYEETVKFVYYFNQLLVNSVSFWKTPDKNKDRPSVGTITVHRSNMVSYMYMYCADFYCLSGKL